MRFLLRETGGNSGATIRSIFLGDGEGGGEMRDGICTDGLRVPAGGVLRRFYTDEGFESLGIARPTWAPSARQRSISSDRDRDVRGSWGSSAASQAAPS